MKFAITVLLFACASPAFAADKLIRTIQCNGVSHDGSRKIVAELRDYKRSSDKFYTLISVKTGAFDGDDLDNSYDGDSSFEEMESDDPEKDRERDGSWGQFFREKSSNRLIVVTSAGQRVDEEARSYAIAVAEEDETVIIQGFLGCTVK